VLQDELEHAADKYQVGNNNRPASPRASQCDFGATLDGDRRALGGWLGFRFRSKGGSPTNKAKRAEERVDRRLMLDPKREEGP
jgi:hypothetical protein